jgi:hypothetical protein
MPSYNLLDLSTVLRSLGRGVVFRAPRWNPGDGPLTLTHLGDTEGDISIATNPEMAALTTPELTGPAPVEMDYTGEAPVITFPMYLTDPTLIALVTPTGQASAGRSRRSAPLEHTLVILPEALFLKTDNAGIVSDYTLASSGGNWTLDGVALDSAQLALLAGSFWAWRGVFTTPPRSYRGGAGDARKNIEEVTFTLLHHPTMPEGHHLYTIGDPDDAGIDLDGGS